MVDTFTYENQSVVKCIRSVPDLAALQALQEWCMDCTGCGINCTECSMINLPSPLYVWPDMKIITGIVYS